MPSKSSERKDEKVTNNHILGPKENKAQLRKTVEDEFKTWTSMSNEHDIVQHFSNSNNTNFLCVVWKMLLESDTINAVAFKVRKNLNF